MIIIKDKDDEGKNSNNNKEGRINDKEDRSEEGRIIIMVKRVKM